MAYVIMAYIVMAPSVWSGIPQQCQIKILDELDLAPLLLHVRPASSRLRRVVYSYGLSSYGQYSDGLYSYGQYSYGLYSYVRPAGSRLRRVVYSYGICKPNHGRYSHCRYSYGI